MSDFFHSIVSMPTPFNMIVLIVLIGTLGGLVGTIVKQARKYASHRHELDLKRDMLDRGMSVEEIERIIRVHSSDGDEGP